MTRSLPGERADRVAALRVIHARDARDGFAVGEHVHAALFVVDGGSCVPIVSGGAEGNLPLDLEVHGVVVEVVEMVVGIVGGGLAVVVGRVVEVAVPGEDAHPHAVFVDAEGDGAGVGRFVVRAVRRRLRRVRVRVLVGRAGAQRVRRRLERGVGVAQRRARELERVVRRIGAGGWRLVGGDPPDMSRTPRLARRVPSPGRASTQIWRRPPETTFSSARADVETTDNQGCFARKEERVRRARRVSRKNLANSVQRGCSRWSRGVRGAQTTLARLGGTPRGK